MKKFKNISTIMLAFSLHDSDPSKKPTDYIVHPNAEKELPADSQYVERLVKQGYLQEVPETKPATQPSTNSKEAK
jgi:hypothetical protein